MKRKLVKLTVAVWIGLGILVVSTITLVDRTPYREKAFYAAMNTRLDSLKEVFSMPESNGEFQIGWSKVNITPPKPAPLAGYGARNPKRMLGLHDSSYVRTVVFQKGDQKAALITADLLMIHPEIFREVVSRLPAEWDAGELYFTATHTHSGPGGWAPGVVGELFSGRFDPEIVNFLSDLVVRSLKEASQQLGSGGFSYGDLVTDELVRNRISAEGRVDSAFRMLLLQKDSLRGVVSFYSAHATCLTHDFQELSGDYPAALNGMLESDSLIDFAAYAAGAVGSMGPKAQNYTGPACVKFMAETLRDQVNMFLLIANGATADPSSIHSFRLKLPLRKPQFKVSENLAIRPYLFRLAFGDYPNHLAVLLLGKTLLIGIPGDFSGELAVPLYQKARAMGFNLIITSFNGGYMGYAIRDQWYDLPHHEARTMSWYGPDVGSYLSEVLNRILDIIDENN